MTRDSPESWHGKSSTISWAETFPGFFSGFLSLSALLYSSSIFSACPVSPVHYSTWRLSNCSSLHLNITPPPFPLHPTYIPFLITTPRTETKFPAQSAYDRAGRPSCLVANLIFFLPCTLYAYVEIQLREFKGRLAASHFSFLQPTNN